MNFYYFTDNIHRNDYNTIYIDIPYLNTINGHLLYRNMSSVGPHVEYMGYNKERINCNSNSNKKCVKEVKCGK